MYLSDLIAQLQNAEESVSGDSIVYIRFDDKEIELFSISARIVDVDDFEIVLE